MQKGITLLGLALTAFSLQAAEAQVNYGKDPVENQQGIGLLDKHPGNPLFIKRHALRSGLCELID